MTGLASFNNTMYSPYALSRIKSVPPIFLVESYYSCVLDVINSVYQATGLTVANTNLCVGLFMLAYTFLVAYYYNKIKGIPVPYKSEKLARERRERKRAERMLVRIIEDIMVLLLWLF